MKTNSLTSRSTINAAAFQWLLAAGVIVDGRAGGLVVGKTLAQGGITAIRQKGGVFYMQRSKVACDDFVLHPGAVPPRFESGYREEPVALEFTQMLVTSAEPDDKILWLTVDQAIVPAEQAMPHLHELNRINDHDNPFLVCDVKNLLCATA